MQIPLSIDHRIKMTEKYILEGAQCLRLPPEGQRSANVWDDVSLEDAKAALTCFDEASEAIQRIRFRIEMKIKEKEA